MADSSFDVVSNVDRKQVDNALNEAAKLLGSGSPIIRVHRRLIRQMSS
jgi:hypothetical protein